MTESMLHGEILRHSFISINFQWHTHTLGPCVCVGLLVVVGVVELGGDFEDSVQDGCCVLHVSLLLLPLNIKIPKPVRVEVQTCCLNRILKHPEGNMKTAFKNSLYFSPDIFSIVFSICAVRAAKRQQRKHTTTTKSR